MRTDLSVPHDGTMVIVISGASGSGKGTTVARLKDEFGPAMHFSISMTTRAPRPGEIDGVHYYFVSREEFERRIQQGLFLEWAEVHGCYYGTPAQAVFDAVDKGHLVVLDIDVQGVEQVKPHLSKAVYVFLYAEEDELRRRLERRGEETPSLERRVRTSRIETERATTLFSRSDILQTVTTNPEEDGIQHVTDVVLNNIMKHGMWYWPRFPIPLARTWFVF